MRRTPLALGAVALAGAWMWGAQSFTAHMTIHMTVVAIAAPLLAFAIAGTRWDPVTLAPASFSPILASVVELGAVWLWHTPVLHHAARESTLVLIAEQGSFLVAGIYLWISVLGGDQTIRSARVATGVIALLLTAMHMTLLGAIIALAPRPLYGHWHGASGLSPLADQHLGGAIMLLIGGIAYLGGGLWLSASLLRPRRTVPHVRSTPS